MATANLPSLPPRRGALTTPLSWPFDDEAPRSTPRKAAPTRKLTDTGKEALRRAAPTRKLTESEHALSAGRAKAASTGKKVAAARSRSRNNGHFLSPLKNPMPWLAAALMGNLMLYAATVAHETQLSRWRSSLGAQKQQNVQLRASLSSARSLSWIDVRARGLGLINPTMIAYLPPLKPPTPARPAGPIGTGAAEGY